MKTRTWMWGAGGLAVLGAAAWWFGPALFGAKATGGGYKTTRVERGELVQTVRATGTIKPLRLVQVGTQVNGPVRKLYVDFNDRVKADQLVAQIDPTVYEARLAQDEANLKQSQANILETEARLTEAQKKLERAQKLVAREMLSQADLDTALANRDTLTAQLEVARASVAQAEATLRTSRANLGYTTIKSPVDGVVVSRNVDEGQTVVASMSAQVLFLIATDLQQVQVEASIPEADIGKIREGQPVTFTVDAYDQSFTGTVSQVRLAASTVQNVVTYPVVINAANPEGKLFPGMTANISCEVARSNEALKIPNAALRFKPEEKTEANGTAGNGGAGTNRTARTGNNGGGLGRGNREGKSGARHGPGSQGTTIWIQPAPGAPPKPVTIQTGINDGAFTEVREPSELREGQDVITGVAENTTASSANTTVNPFMPRMPGGGGRGGPRPH